ncbi:cytochrome c oxidase assembly protein COX18, mitochondrial isoform X2 [Photinus pyralis]|uniref:cytochrome c oxidase assembly protein COX18, mitochondrial isoform X2 n=1 Tax=Photinus pyralis TaxID=7054 RepID=UPI001266EF5A|nr:cytochrome c oxidase assembly protein COX18, mitochondrial isoform X2 [Photinus pyralis]
MYSVLLKRPAYALPRFYKLTRNERRFSLNSITDALRVQSGIFRIISESAPVECLQKFVINVHDVTGLPWWATIVCTTFFLRSTVTVPLALYQNFVMAKVQNAQAELIELSKELKREVAVAVKLYDWDQKTAAYNFKRSLKKQWKALIERDNCHPAKASLLIWFQLPLWVCFSVALRNLAYQLPHSHVNAELVHHDLSVEGFGWIVNLTQVDPYFVLPLSFGLINLTIIEAASRRGSPSKFQRFVLNFFRGVTIVMVPVAAGVPSCITLYWTTSSLYGFVQNLVLMSPKLKRWCRIPKTPNDIDKPYSHVIKGIKNKFVVSKIS